MSTNVNEPNVQMTVRQEPGAGVIAIRGEVTGFAEEALMNAYNTASDGDGGVVILDFTCLLYTSPSPRDRTRYRMPSSA